MFKIPDSLYSIRLESNIIGGLLNHPEVLMEIEVLDANDFFHKTHKALFSLYKNLVFSGKPVDKVILAQKAKDLAINVFEDINLFEYLESISFSKINSNGLKELIKDLIKLRVKREIWQDAQQVQEIISEKNDDSIEELIAKSDKIYNSRINQYVSSDTPTDLFAEAKEIINDRVLNADKIVTVATPFPIFNDMFGHLRVGITAICGRAKNNKSSILLNMGFGSIVQNKELHILYLDTELKKYDHVFRCMAAFSQINANYFEDGSWSKNANFVEKVGKTWNIVDSLKGRFHHHYIGNRPIEEVISIIRRWYYSVCQRGGRGLVILDYIKIGDEKLSNYNGEHQELGRKINSLNSISQQLNLPILSSMQLNRSAITDNKEDESAISMTDRLSWFANGVFIFRKKRPEEISEEGIKFGTHKLIPVVLRYEGKNTSLLDLVRTVDSHANKIRYKSNFINYNFSNFLLEERGTLRDIIKYQSLNNNLQDNVGKSNNI